MDHYKKLTKRLARLMFLPHVSSKITLVKTGNKYYIESGLEPQREIGGNLSSRSIMSAMKEMVMDNLSHARRLT